MSSRRTGWYWVKFNTDPEWRPMYMEKDLRIIDFESWRLFPHGVPSATPDEIGPRINTPDEDQQDRPITLDDLRRIAGNLPDGRLTVYAGGEVSFGNYYMGNWVVRDRICDALDILDAKPRRTVLQALKGESE